MLTKHRIAQIRQSRRHGNLYLPGEDVDALLDAVETLTEAIEARVKLDAFGVSSNGILCEALAKVYGEEKR